MAVINDMVTFGRRFDGIMKRLPMLYERSRRLLNQGEGRRVEKTMSTSRRT